MLNNPIRQACLRQAGMLPKFSKADLYGICWMIDMVFYNS
jgi:hypothetical protein